MIEKLVVNPVAPTILTLGADVYSVPEFNRLTSLTYTPVDPYSNFAIPDAPIPPPPVNISPTSEGGS